MSWSVECVSLLAMATKYNYNYQTLKEEMSFVGCELE